MKEKNKLNSFYLVLDYAFPVYFTLYFIEFFYGIWGLSTLVKFVCILMTLFYGIRIINESKGIQNFNRTFTYFYIYYILTGLMYLFNGIPFKCYLNELYNSIPAMFFVYVGVAEKSESRQFYRKYLIACTITMAIGLFLYVTTPGWYMSRRVEIVSNTVYSTTTYSEDSLLGTMRFSSFLLDNYEVDMYAMIGLSIALFVYYFKPWKKHANLVVVCILINFIATILTQQRVAMAAAIGFLVFCIVYGSLYGKKNQSSRIFLISCIIISLTMFFVLAKYGARVEQLNDLVTDRFDNMSLTQAMSEREYQHKHLINNWTMPIFGHGAGSGGAAAGRLGFPHVSDAAYYELLYETGIVGVLFFILVIGMTIKRALKNLRYYLTELMIIVFVLLAMLGSNTLTLGYMIIFPFWYAVGRIWNRNYYKVCKKEVV